MDPLKARPLNDNDVAAETETAAVAAMAGRIASSAGQAMQVYQRVEQESSQVLARIAWTLLLAIRAGGKVLFCGNGGSAADAQHVAGELMGRFLVNREPWPAIALTTDSSVLTAVANDFGYEDVFARQVRALVRPGDVVVGISTSGTSPNIVKALDEGRKRGAVCIGFTGERGRSLDQHCDVCFVAPSKDTPRIQEAHILAWHSVCEAVEEELTKRT